MLGVLQPLPGGDPIDLLKHHLVVGRREACDIVLDFGGLSGRHALLKLEQGIWFVTDLRTRNGIRVHGKRLLVGARQPLYPGTKFTLGKHEFIIQYDPDQLRDIASPDDPIDGGESGVGVRPRLGPNDTPPMGQAASPEREG